MPCAPPVASVVPVVIFFMCYQERATARFEARHCPCRSLSRGTDVGGLLIGMQAEAVKAFVAVLGLACSVSTRARIYM